MKKIIFLALLAVIPAMAHVKVRNGFEAHKNTAQYKGSDYRNAVKVERGITIEQAFTIAESNPEIDYFVYTKGAQMVLEVPAEALFESSLDPLKLVSYNEFAYDSGDRDAGYCRIFRHGDAVFFKKEGIWLGNAPGLADTYVKVKAK